MATFGKCVRFCPLLVLLGLVVATSAEAQQPYRYVYRYQPEPLAAPNQLPMPAQGHVQAPIQRLYKSPVQAPYGKTCCPPYCVRYHHHRTLKKVCCGCCVPQTIVLNVPDPNRCGCSVQVTLCIPGCCKGAPMVRAGSGLLCRGVVNYQWCCGYKVRVVFKKHGDVVVHSYGR